ncbi:hypothetical protein QTO11_28290, partial [Vibrio campbellii]
EKQRMSETIIQFRAEHAARMAKLDNEVSSYREEIQRLTSEVYDIGTREQSISQELRNVVRDVGMAVEQLVNVSDLPDRGFDLTKGISDATNRARKILDMPLVVHRSQYSYNEPPMDFDDEIPF